MVALAYALIQVILVLPHTRDGLGWDETVYVSQSDPRTPAAYFSAPRSRGISFLIAPILAVSPSVTLLRTVLALASAMALYGAFRVWTPLLGRRTTALAASLFAGLWTTMLNGSQVMPQFVGGTGGRRGGRMVPAGPRGTVRPVVAGRRHRPRDTPPLS
ncbi:MULTISPECIES: hypothetical protein [Streptomyces]|uniref:hypothetical protein n=1 Tax=Streptomyces TaxID=1883 RepID=UPI0002AC6F0C|nr:MULTISPECIES: hypothetical protein [Streptomyces]